MARKAKSSPLPFRTSDWLQCQVLRELPPDVRGLWLDCLCYMWESAERGVLLNEQGNPMSKQEAVRLIGLDASGTDAWIDKLIEKGLWSVREDGALYSEELVRKAVISRKRAIAGRKGGKTKGLHYNEGSNLFPSDPPKEAESKPKPAKKPEPPKEAKRASEPSKRTEAPLETEERPKEQEAAPKPKQAAADSLAVQKRAAEPPNETAQQRVRGPIQLEIPEFLPPPDPTQAEKAKVLKATKYKFADNVNLTREEYYKLVERYSQADVNGMIELLNAYKGQNGKRYRSDYMAILNWVVNAYYERKQKGYENQRTGLFSGIGDGHNQGAPGGTGAPDARHVHEGGGKPQKDYSERF